MRQRRAKSTLQKPVDTSLQQRATQFEHALMNDGLSARAIGLFRNVVYNYYKNYGRNLPWRKTKRPYNILVSEFMLQQTQVERVMDKYLLFLKRFPDFKTLAHASLREVLQVWQGLGYNRRALHLRKAAQLVTAQWHGRLLCDIEKLMALPGVGKATASAIAVFAFDQPVAFVETNIRTVFLHFFFKDKKHVTDAEILVFVVKTMDRARPSQWYHALMDFGAMLKKQYGNPNWRSAHHAQQKPFAGSDRQVRGQILRLLTQHTCLSQRKLVGLLRVSTKRLAYILSQLEKDHLVKKKGRSYTIA